MTNYLDYAAPSTFRSKFNPAIGLHPDFIFSYNKHFLDPLFVEFCSELKLKPDELEFISMDDIITEKEFANSGKSELIKPYFYDIIFKMIFKNFAGVIRNKINFTFTYDLDLTPQQSGKIRFGTINLGNQPIFYYIFVDIQKSISFIKSLE
jgi:hypothetical protein